MKISEKHFMDKVIPEPTTGCWLWIGPQNDRGYGNYRLGHKNLKAHRVAFELFVGPIVDGNFVCHRCDTPLCVNPRHLFQANHSANMLGMTKKGRNPTHKISYEIASEIRKLHAATGMMTTELSKIFGMHRTSIGLILKGKIWKT